MPSWADETGSLKRIHRHKYCQQSRSPSYGSNRALRSTRLASHFVSVGQCPKHETGDVIVLLDACVMITATGFVYIDDLFQKPLTPLAH